MRDREPFAEGDPCLLYDEKGRRYLLTLRSGGEFQYHLGRLPHAEIIGAIPGATLYSSKRSELIPMRPRLADYILKMKRGATVLYPKDLGPMVVWADIGPGMSVLEAGTGSGALSMALARAVGREGRVVTVERRDDHADLARRRIETFFGEWPQQLELRIGMVEDAVADVMPERIILDLPEPWHTVGAASEHLPGGGVFACFLPTVPQVQEVRAALNDADTFIEATTFEVLQREWAVEDRSVRPSHQMIGHTGFITVARKRLS